MSQYFQARQALQSLRGQRREMYEKIEQMRNDIVQAEQEVNATKEEALFHKLLSINDRWRSRGDTSWVTCHTWRPAHTEEERNWEQANREFHSALERLIKCKRKLLKSYKDRRAFENRAVRLEFTEKALV